MLKYMFCRL